MADHERQLGRDFTSGSCIVVGGLSSSLGLIGTVVCSCSCLGFGLAVVIALVYFLVIKKKSEGGDGDGMSPSVDEFEAVTVEDAPPGVEPAPEPASAPAPSEPTPVAAPLDSTAGDNVGSDNADAVEATPAPSMPGASGDDHRV